MRTIHLFIFIALFFVANPGYSQHNHHQNHHQNYLPVDSLYLEQYLSNDLSKDYTNIDLTNASIRLPKYFENYEQDDMFCYLHKETSSTILAFGNKEASVDSVLMNVDGKMFEEQGVTLLSEKDIFSNFKYPVKVYFLKFNANGVAMNRIMFFTGSQTESLVLMANFPEIFSPLMKNLILSSFLTVKFSK